MDLIQHLRIFQRVADSGGFSRAAAQLGLAPSSVSAAVRALEQALGARLFQRTTRRVRLSSDGELLLARSRDLLADAASVEQLFRVDERPAGLLRVDVPGRMARLQIAPSLPAFLAAHPDVDIEFSGSDQINDPLVEGIDCVLRVGEPGDVNLAARSLGHLRQVTCASPALLAASPPVATLDDVAALPAVHFGRRSVGKAECFEFNTPRGLLSLGMRVRVSVLDAETYIACALAGLGAIQLPRYDIAAHLDAGELVELMPESPPPDLPLHVLYPPQQRSSRLLQAFIDWLEALMAPYTSTRADTQGAAQKAW